ncbi:coatomer epsilon subunit-domain-containing protein [Phellopilus nigrolimitatus]|nr:coatomer epsilon subunit-domain-containing protein [Phellopilus nigrolimitatus]
MDSSDLYHVKQQFTLGAYKSLADLALPDASAPDHTSFVLYKARALIALGQAKAAEALIPEDTEAFPLKAARALAAAVDGDGDSDAALETLRDLCVEIDGEDLGAAEKWYVRVLAGTAFARAGEVEEALETLGVGSNKESLEAVSLVVQIYLSLARADLARREYQRALAWAEDDLLLQSIEAALGLATGADAYANSASYYTEQLGNPALSSSHLLTSRGVARLLRGEVHEARSDLEEVLKGADADDEEALGASVVVAGLGANKKGEADELFR